MLQYKQINDLHWIPVLKVILCVCFGMFSVLSSGCNAQGVQPVKTATKDLVKPVSATKTEQNGSTESTPIVSKVIPYTIGGVSGNIRYYSGCKTCGGDGLVCSHCKGTGHEPGGVVKTSSKGGVTYAEALCTQCNGMKYVRCYECTRINVRLHPEESISMEEEIGREAV